MKRLCIIIPAFNEVDSLPELVYEINAIDFGDELLVDILIVNDGSTDGTELLKFDQNCVQLNLCNNLGIGGAVQTGLIYANECGHDYALQVDGDGQHPPAEIPKFIEFLKQNPNIDMVIGSRYIDETGFQSSWIRRLGIRFFSIVISILTGTKFLDTTSGFRLFTSSTLRYFAVNYPDEFPEPESLVIAAMLGFKIVEIPVVMKKREMGASSITPVKSIYYMIKVMLAIIFTFIKTKYILSR